MVGSTCGFINWYPTDDNIETCQHINVSYEHYWDPTKHIFKISPTEEHTWSNMLNLSSINQVRSQTPYDPPLKCIQYDTEIHDFDRAMVNVSTRLAKDLMVDKIIGNIWVSMNKRDMQQLKMKGYTQ